MSGFFEECSGEKFIALRQLTSSLRDYHSDRVGGFSGVGVAKLDIPPSRRALVDGISIALILAWAYDVTPQGIRATPGPRGERRNLIMLIA